MKKEIFYPFTFGLVLFMTLTSCNRNFCEGETFYSVYRERFAEVKVSEDFVQNDSEIKKAIFSSLCLKSNIKKMLIVEWRNGLQSFFSRGLLFTYDDSSTYYFTTRKDKTITGKGVGKNEDLNEVLLQVKEDFFKQKIRMDKNYDDVFDASVMNVVLFDSYSKKRFESFSFPSFKWNAN
ncbi:MAG: hypothetical protein H6627_14970 [Calditrichae bacterium]|nr:hypothetical protein [Calditrichia bacterium]